VVIPRSAILKVFGLSVIGLIAAVQLVPYGRKHANPPASKEPAWSSAQARDLAVRACFDCHSNETVWPWYSHVAPVSWLVQRDVEHGRRKLNFSEWNRPQEESDESARAVRKGSMPPWYYPWPRLSPSERLVLIQALEAIQPVRDKRERGHDRGSERERSRRS
jgi:mono/diheme cytochrome c family protein